MNPVSKIRLGVYSSIAAIACAGQVGVARLEARASSLLTPHNESPPRHYLSMLVVRRCVHGQAPSGGSSYAFLLPTTGGGGVDTP